MERLTRNIGREICLKISNICEVERGGLDCLFVSAILYPENNISSCQHSVRVIIAPQTAWLFPLPIQQPYPYTMWMTGLVDEQLFRMILVQRPDRPVQLAY